MIYILLLPKSICAKNLEVITETSYLDQIMTQNPTMPKHPRTELQQERM